MSDQHRQRDGQPPTDGIHGGEDVAVAAARHSELIGRAPSAATLLAETLEEA